MDRPLPAPALAPARGGGGVGGRRQRGDSKAESPRESAGRRLQAEALGELAHVVAIALAFTLGPGVWTSREQVQEDTAILELMPVAENVEFFNAMEMLDNLDVLESMGGQGNAA